MRLKTALLGIVAMLGVYGSAQAQLPKVDLHAEEAAIRALANRPDELPRTRDVIFWSGLYPRPKVGREEVVKPFPGAAAEQRRNVRIITNQIVRLQLAAAGDMAYEFSNFTLSYDRGDTKQHRSFTGSVLRVWMKGDGQWRVAAEFMRPHDVPFARENSQ